MNHELKIINGSSETITQDFGVSTESFEAMVDNINLEIHHATIFRNDDRDHSRCLMDVLENLEPADFGLEPKTANDYLVVGMAFAKAIEMEEAMMDGIKSRAREKGGDIISSLLRRMAERENDPGKFKTVGSVN